MINLENGFCFQKNIAKKKVPYSNYQKQLKVAIVGGSNSVMRSGYTQYLPEYITENTSKEVQLSYFALGGVTSVFGAIQNSRHSIAKSHDIIFFEYCVNDRSALIHGKYTYKMAGMSLEGFIRQAKSMNPNCIIIILIFGTNLPYYYNNSCKISAMYENIARRYEIPVINITEILLAKNGIKFIKKLYKENDAAHYSRPYGAIIVAKLIAEQIRTSNLFSLQPKGINKYYRMYPDNLQNLKFFSDFSSIENQNNLEKSTFKNRIFEEEIYTLKAGSFLNLNFKGKLVGIMLKSDWYDGLFKIKLGEEELITSSFSTWIKQEEMSNLNFLSLPFKKSMGCDEVSELSISVCQTNQENYELDLHKRIPKVAPTEWKTSIIGIAYIGEINLE